MRPRFCSAAPLGGSSSRRPPLLPFSWVPPWPPLRASWVPFWLPGANLAKPGFIVRGLCPTGICLVLLPHGPCAVLTRFSSYLMFIVLACSFVLLLSLPFLLLPAFPHLPALSSARAAPSFPLRSVLRGSRPVGRSQLTRAGWAPAAVHGVSRGRLESGVGGH